MSRHSHLATLRRPDIARNARQLRAQMTDAERRLWYLLRAGRFDGWKFRRQVPIGPYVADFLCERARLIVELDGGHHGEQTARDAERSAWLERRGYTVKRYWNNEVLGNMEGVLEDLARLLAPAA